LTAGEDMRKIAMEKINAVVHVFSTYLYTNGRVQSIGLILLLRDERVGSVDEKEFCCIITSS